jgi:ABC-2 type transport system ATP-binding protein
MIQVQGLTRNFRNVEALQNVSFSVEPGEILGLIGPNGAGKSTAIRCITGILKPTSGTVSIGGANIFEEPVAAKQRLAYLPDNPTLFENLIAWEHVELVARIYGVKNFEKRAHALFDEFGLSAQKNSLGSELSRGMRQRLSLICALIHEPKALLLDEPMLGLDPQGIRLINDTIKREAANGAAIIISSHLLALLEEVCTKVLMLTGGRVRVYGTVESVRSQISEASERLSLEELFFHATEKQSKP